jgi:hypothetical protein
MEIKNNYLLSFASLICLIFIGQVWTAGPANATESAVTEDITVIKCEDITFPGAVDVEVRYDGKVLKMVGVSADNHQIPITEIKPQKEVVGKVDDYDCEGNTISITEKWGFKSIYITQIYEWNGKNLHQTATKVSDPSAENIEAALQEALAGNLDKASSYLEGVMYPWNYLGCGTVVDFLRKGSGKATTIQKAKGLQQAAIALGNVLELIVEAYNYSLMSEPQIIAPIPERWLQIFKLCDVNVTEYTLALNNYGYFLQESGKNQEAVKVLNAVIREDPKRTVAYLNLADALWAVGNHNESRINMKEYVRLMTEAGKARKIPKRVQERLR